MSVTLLARSRKTVPYLLWLWLDEKPAGTSESGVFNSSLTNMSKITLWCWVLGDSHDRIFAVSIKRSDTIYNLKTAIHKLKPSFQEIDADTLDIYKYKVGE